MLRLGVLATLVVCCAALTPASARLAVLTTPRAYGDIDGDGRQEVAAVVERQRDGHPTEVYVALFARRSDRPALLATARLADGAAVDRLRIVTGRLTASFRRHYPIDPPCCPSREVVRTYALAHGRLHGGDHATPRAAWQRVADSVALSAGGQPER
jgi:hypothetical protein